MRAIAELEAQLNLSSASRKRIAIAKNLAPIIASCDSNIEEVRLFGSVARGMATRQSDTDLNIITRSQGQWLDDIDYRLELTTRITGVIRNAGYQVSVHHLNRLPTEKIASGIDFGVYTDAPTHTTYEFPPGPEEEQVVLYKKAN